MKTIFVAIPSYNDRELLHTITGLVVNATHRQRVHIAVVDQCDDAHRLDLRDFAHLVDYIALEERMARGPVFARAMANLLYRGEDFYVQLDAHTQCDPGWDEWVEQTMAGAPHPRCVFSALPPSYTRVNGEAVLDRLPRGMVNIMLVEPGVVFADDEYTLPFTSQWIARRTAFPARTIAGGMVIAPGTMVQEVPLDPQIYFYGEEQTQALRLFTHGYDLFHPVDPPFYHLYNSNDDPVRDVPWQADRDEARKVRWWQYEHRSRAQQAALYAGTLRGMYGLGTARTMDAFAAMSGICYRTRTVAPSAYALPVGA